MEAVLNALKSIDYSNIPIGKIAAVIVILTITQTLRRFVLAVIIKTIEKFTSKTETTLDDEKSSQKSRAMGTTLGGSGARLFRDTPQCPGIGANRFVGG